MWVIFEGLDKAGKTTLEWEFLKATNFKHVVIDRGPVGYMVFDKLLNRNTEAGFQNFVSQANKVVRSKDFMVIYCKVSSHIAEARLTAVGELNDLQYDYKEAQTLYDEYVNLYYPKSRTIEIDTNKPIFECVDQIVKKLKEVFKSEL